MGTTDLPLRSLEKELRPIARERIARGQMPREAPTRFWGGFGTGALRAVRQADSVRRDRIRSQAHRGSYTSASVSQSLPLRMAA